MSLKEELTVLANKGNLTANELSHVVMSDYYIVLSNQLRELQDQTKLFDHKQVIKKCLDIHIANYKRWKSQYKGTQATDFHPEIEIIPR